MKPWRGSIVCLLAAGAFVACTGGGPEEGAPRPTGDRARLLGAIPPETAERGVYIYDPSAPEDLLPGSLAGPDLAVILQRAELVVETAVPPLVLAAGVPEDVVLPDDVSMVDGVVIAAVDGDERAAAADRLRQGAAPEGVLAELGAASEPVGWAGPAEVASSNAGGLGDVVVRLSSSRIHIRAETPTPDEAIRPIARSLGTGTVPSSPGKAWTDLLGAQDVFEEEGAVVVRARPQGLPGLLLRQLIDSRSLSFLTAG